MAKRDGKETQLTIKKCNQIYQGTNAKGDEYTIYEVDACKPDGTPINEKLRSFTPLIVGQTLDLTVVPYNSERHGRSFTLYPKGSSRATGSSEAINDLREQMAHMAEQLENTRGRLKTVEAIVAELRGGSAAAGNGASADEDGPSAADLDARFGAEAPY